MRFNWNSEKNSWLKENRDITFDEITCLIAEGRLLAVLQHDKKKGQKVFVVERDGYAYNVPFVEENDGTCFLKTAYPSRVSTKKYLRRRSDEKNSAE